MLAVSLACLIVRFHRHQLSCSDHPLEHSSQSSLNPTMRVALRLSVKRRCTGQHSMTCFSRIAWLQCKAGLVTPIPNCLCICCGLQHVVSPTEASLVTMVLQQALVCSISEANMSASATCQPNCADDKVSQENSIVPATCGPARLQREQKCSCF